MLQLDSGVVVVVLAGFVADLIVEGGVTELELLRDVFHAVVLEGGAVHHAVGEGVHGLGTVLYISLLNDFSKSEHVSQVLRVKLLNTEGIGGNFNGRI